MAISELRPVAPNASRGRVPPHNVEAEESLLGAMLLSKDAVAVAAEAGLSHADFYKPSHGHIYDAITTLFGRGEPADPVMVSEELRRAGLLEGVGGPAALITLQARTPATSSAGHYARIVEELALLRRLIGAADQIAEIGYELPDDVAAAVDRAESLVYEVAQRRVTDSIAGVHDLVLESLERLEHLYEQGENVTGLPTGFVDLDDRLAGLQPSNLIIVGGRPATGKTSFALGIAAHAAQHGGKPVLLFSLEMSHSELTGRLLGAEARVDGARLRNGKLHESDWPKITQAAGRLAEMQLYIDDNPHLTVMEIRAKARRMRSKLGGLGLIVVDYLQLMTGGRSNAENRQVEVSEISRGLKILARELQVPVIALSQLSRNLELRADKRPQLADLRESGCLTADTRVLRADTGAEVSMGELLATRERDIPVWTLDGDLRMVRGTMSHVFSSGVKPVFELQLASGRRVKASANHPFLTLDGWRRLDELAVGDRLAVPRVVPDPVSTESWPEAEIVMLAHLIGDGCFASRQPLHYTSADPANLDAVEQVAAHWGITPRRVPQKTWSHVYLPSPHRLTHGRRNPICSWLRDLGLYGLRSPEKFVPREVFLLPNDQIALFLRHLWATDGSVRLDTKANQARIYYASTSRRLVDDVAGLLLRLGILSRIKEVTKAGYRPGYHLYVYGAANQIHFAESIGVHGARGDLLPAIVAFLRTKTANTNLDTVPVGVWADVKARMVERGVTARGLAAGLGTAYCGSTLYKHAPSRERLGRVATLLDDENLHRLASSDVFWDTVTAIVPRGEEPVYDATVIGTHNFIADGIAVHNSLEQDADVVLFVYRDELYNRETTEDPGGAEIIIAKHRNGPVGTVHLVFLEKYARFANQARGV